MAAFLSPVFGAGAQLFNNQGIVLAGGKINTYLAGSTTPQATWTDPTQAVFNANPIILDSTGKIPGSGEMWLQSGIAYKLVVTDSLNNPIGTWDNVSGINDVSATASEWAATGLTPTFISTTSFSVPGNQTAVFPVNQRVKFTVSAGVGYGYVLSSTFSTVTTVVIVPDSTLLDGGLNVINVGFLKATNPSVPQEYPQMNTAITVASAATTPIGAAPSLNVTVSGAVTITAFDNVPAGILKFVKFTGSLTLTYNAVSLILPGALNLTTNPGDQAIFRSLGSGNWELVGYLGNFTFTSSTSRRNTILIGPMDTSGMPSLLPQTVTGLNLTSQNVVSLEATQTANVTFTNGSAVIGWTGNTLVVNQAVNLTNSGGALPTNFVALTTYYVSATGLSSTQFELAATPGGTPIVAGSAGSGTQTAWAGVQNVVAATAYFGNDSISGELNIGGIASANLTWTGLTNNTTNYLYVTVSGGTLTPGFSALAPVIVYGSATTPAIAAGQITVNVTLGETYLGNGSTAVETPMVIVGTATTSGGNITATTTYVYGKPQTFPTKKSGTLLRRTVYNTAGTFTWIKSAQTTAINVKVQGGGGTGGTGTTAAGGGGGQGGYGESFIDASGFITQTITLAAGGSSTFGSLITCTAGGNGAPIQGGTGGTSTGADININGQGGGFGGNGAQGGGAGGGMGGGVGGNSGPSAGAAGNMGGGGGGGGSTGAAGSAGGANSVGYVIVDEYA